MALTYLKTSDVQKKIDRIKQMGGNARFKLVGGSQLHGQYWNLYIDRINPKTNRPQKNFKILYYVGLNEVSSELDKLIATTRDPSLQSHRWYRTTNRLLLKNRKKKTRKKVIRRKRRVVRRNPIRSSFDKPTFGPGQVEFHRVDTTTLAGIKEAEKFQRAGWYISQVTPFRTTFYRKRALPKNSMARQIRGNPGDSDLIDGAVDVIINTRDFCGNEKQAVRDYCFENKVSDCKGLYRMAMAKANLKWNAYRREAGVRCVRRNPPMYAHRMTSHRTHGLSLKQMMKLYRLVSSGNPKAVMYARRTLGIPMSESLSQVKAVVYHHVMDLKGKM